ncbi:hypothetical protein D3C86_1396960 [compost metagenome]
MALTETEKEAVRGYLGIPSVSAWVTAGNPGLNLTERLRNLSVEAEARVKALLAKIGASRTAIDGALDRTKASMVGAITLNPMEIPQRWEADFNLCQELGTILDFEVRNHPHLGRSGIIEAEMV